jgi:AhpC/TSA family
MRIAGTLPIACFVLFSVSGCDKPPPAARSRPVPEAMPAAKRSALPAKPTAEWTASEILQQLLATYRQATTYQDQAVVRLEYRQGSQPVNQEWPAAVAFERPGKLSIVAYQATVKCDGRELKARIEDVDSKNLDNQIMVRPAPKDLKLADLASDALLYDILSSRLRRQPIQLELLLESGGLVSAFSADIACKRLADASHEGRACFRVEVPSPGGAFIFWVDQADSLLRRLDYPAAALISDLASDPTVSELSLIADLRGAKVGEPILPAHFSLEVPANAKRVKAFVIPPRPLPSDLFGQEPREYFFTKLDDGKLSDKDLAGKITVLVWYHDNPACEATLHQVSLAHKRLADEAAFYAVATDPTSSSSDFLRRRLADWNVELPIVRDLEAFGDKSFHIEVQPTIVVLDKRGCVQIFEPGGNPELADQLIAIVERLKRGDDLAGEIVNQHAREQREYEQLLARGGPEPGELVELPEAVIRQRSQPKKLQIAPLWTCADLKSPGNAVVVETPDQPTTLLIVEGWRTIAEVNSEGKVIARHPLEIPEQAAVTFVRTTTDKSGKRYYLASAPLAPQFFLLDDAWRLLVAYPPAGQAPLRVVDLTFADLDDADGIPEVVVASAGDVGLIAVSLAGEVRWRNRTFPNALSVAATQPDELGSWGLLVAGESGSVLRVNRFGNEEPAVTIGKWPIGRLFGGRFDGGEQAAILALSSNDKGQPFAVGLSEKLKEQWNYPLPAGMHQRPIEPVTSSRMLPGHKGEWWLAGPDGSIHLITADGRLFDSFHYGVPLTGIAAGKLGQRAVLFIATDQGLEAWKVQTER